ncbi:class E sortase [Streptomyces sp. NBC_00287]|uniref:class E sortase n=1 Tax=Streptomyces sp. NBC_00287 TaxID=2975702 RepID=UPI002E2BC9B8|nr:class E sortase [Streptomyces sp. NBC_00287]
MPGPLVVQHRTRRRRALRRRALWTGGELLVTVGLVLLLLVVHQLWWTNREAKAEAREGVAALEREWAASPEESTEPAPRTSPEETSPEAAPSEASQATQPPAPQRQPTPDWSHAYAILTIPALDLRVPVAEGISKTGVLNKGYVGHYPDTQQPGRPGNFAIAGHRNTHGEPFRRLDRLGDGDEIVVETKAAVYTYAVDQTLAQTSAHDTGVIRPVPRSLVHPGRGYREPGYYLTLTTCTPEYTSRYRLVVWGTLRSMRAR